MTRNGLRGLVVAAAFAAIGPAAGAATLLHVGKSSQNSSAEIPVDVGVKVGIFAKRGLDVRIADFQGGGKLAQAMAAGSIDIGISGGPEMALIAKGAPELAVCNAVPTVPFIGITVPADSPVRTVDDLRGKKIGVASVASLSEWLTLELARKRGWGLNGVTPVAIGNAPSAIIAAFRTHQVDAVTTATAFGFALEASKQGRLLIPVSDYEGRLSAGTTYATRTLMAKDPNALRQFLAGWYDTITYMRSHKAETVAIERGVTGYPPDVQSKEYDLTIGMFSMDCKFDAESLANLRRSFIDLKLVPAPPDMSKLYTEAFLPKR